MLIAGVATTTIHTRVSVVTSGIKSETDWSFLYSHWKGSVVLRLQMTRTTSSRYLPLVVDQNEDLMVPGEADKVMLYSRAGPHLSPAS